MNRPLPCLISIFVALAACQTHQKERNDTAEALTSNERTFAFAPPKGRAGEAEREKWTAVPRHGGAEYVQSKDGLEDVVSMYGFAMPVEASVKTIDDLESMLRADGALGFVSLKQDTILGHPVLRFEKQTEDAGSMEKLAGQLGLPPRQADAKFLVRTRGAFLLRGGKEPRVITLACARTSQHGEIGSYYEELFDDYLASWVADYMQ